jgi:hypothetical protein
LTAAPLPNNERQVRELVGLKPEQQREVWTASVKSASDKRPTAKRVREAKEKLPPATLTKEPIIIEPWKLAKKVEEPFGKFISNLFKKSMPHNTTRFCD